MELDASNGFCLDGDMKAVRYINTERDKVYKMKAGKSDFPTLKKFELVEIYQAAKTYIS